MGISPLVIFGVVVLAILLLSKVTGFVLRLGMTAALFTLLTPALSQYGIGGYAGSLVGSYFLIKTLLRDNLLYFAVTYVALFFLTKTLV